MTLNRDKYKLWYEFRRRHRREGHQYDFKYNPSLKDNKECALSNKLYDLGISDPTERCAATLRKRADELERRRRPVARPPHPPRLTADDEAEIEQLRKKIEHLKVRIIERKIAELEDMRASPTALRHIADAMDAVIEERKAREREEEEERRRWNERIFGSADPFDMFREALGGGSASRRDPLAVLNLRSGATPDEIKTRYRQLVKILHPDANSGSEAASALYDAVVKAMRELEEMGRA